MFHFPMSKQIIDQQWFLTLQIKGQSDIMYPLMKTAPPKDLPVMSNLNLMRLLIQLPNFGIHRALRKIANDIMESATSELKI